MSTDWLNWKFTGERGKVVIADGGLLTEEYLKAFSTLRGPLSCNICLREFNAGEWGKQWQGPRGCAAPIACWECAHDLTKEELDEKVIENLVKFRALQRAFNPDNWRALI